MHLCPFSTEETQAAWLRWSHLWAGPQVSSCSHNRQEWAADLPLLDRECGGGGQGNGAGWGSRCFQIQFRCVSGLDTTLPPECRPGSFLEPWGIPGGGLCSPPGWHHAVGESIALKAERLASDPYLCTGHLRRLLTFLGHVSSSAFWDNSYLTRLQRGQ